MPCENVRGKCRVEDLTCRTDQLMPRLWKRGPATSGSAAAKMERMKVFAAERGVSRQGLREEFKPGGLPTALAEYLVRESTFSGALQKD